MVSPWATNSVAPPPPAGSFYDHASLAATLRRMLPLNFPAPLTARDAAAAPLDFLWEATDLPAGPRTDTPARLPPVPAEVTPSMVGVSREGGGPLNHLQHSLLLLAEGAAGAVEGAAGAVEGAAAAGEGGALRLRGVRSALEASGALSSEASAGLYARRRLAKFLKK